MSGAGNRSHRLTTLAVSSWGERAVCSTASIASPLILSALLNSCASAGANLLETHPKRKGDEHNSEAPCGQAVEFAAWVEGPTYGTCHPRNAYIHSHHDDRKDRPQQRDLNRHLCCRRRGELRKEQAEE